MTVRRIVPNIAADNVALASTFYRDVLDLDLTMDLGWIQTFCGDAPTVPQISVASEGGSGSAVPDLSIEFDNLDATIDDFLIGRESLRRKIGQSTFLCARK